MKSLFQFLLNQYNLINFQELSIERKSKVNYGLQKLNYRAPLLWAKLLSMFLKPHQMKLNKKKIENAKIGHVGYAKYMNHISNILTN